MAQVIAQAARPALVIAHNKTLAAQLCNEFRELLPEAAVEYFVSYYDYYQPEAYIAATDTYIEKDSSINDEIDRLRHSATAALLARRDVVIVASVSCIYGVGSPGDLPRPGGAADRGRGAPARASSSAGWSRSSTSATTWCWSAAASGCAATPWRSSRRTPRSAYRISMFGDEVESITEFDPLTGEVHDYARATCAIYPATHYVTPPETIDRALARHPRRAGGAAARRSRPRASSWRPTGCGSAPSTTWR